MDGEGSGFRKVLVVRPGALGDTIISLPAVRALRRSAGAGGEVGWVGYLPYLRLAVNPLHASAIYSVDRALFSGLFSESVCSDLIRFLSSYDMVVLWCRDGNGHSRRLMERLGVRYIHCVPFPADGSGIHATEHLMRSLEFSMRFCRANGCPNQPELVLSGEAETEGDALMRALGLQAGNFVALHPGSGDIRKNWSPAKLSRIADLAVASGLGVVVIEGEADAVAVQKMLEYLNPPPALLRVEDLLVVARVLSAAAAYVGNDSGISHLAAAAGAPTVALFGPTDPRSWAPRGRSVRVLPLSSSPQAVWSTIQMALQGSTEVNP